MQNCRRLDKATIKNRYLRLSEVVHKLRGASYFTNYQLADDLANDDECAFLPPCLPGGSYRLYGQRAFHLELPQSGRRMRPIFHTALRRPYHFPTSTIQQRAATTSSSQRPL